MKKFKQKTSGVFSLVCIVLFCVGGVKSQSLHGLLTKTEVEYLDTSFVSGEIPWGLIYEKFEKLKEEGVSLVGSKRLSLGYARKAFYAIPELTLGKHEHTKVRIILFKSGNMPYLLRIEVTKPEVIQKYASGVCVVKRKVGFSIVKAHPR